MKDESLCVVKEIVHHLNCFHDDKRARKVWNLIFDLVSGTMAETRSECPISGESFDYQIFDPVDSVEVENE